MPQSKSLHATRSRSARLAHSSLPAEPCKAASSSKTWPSPTLPVQMLQYSSQCVDCFFSGLSLRQTLHIHTLSTPHPHPLDLLPDTGPQYTRMAPYGLRLMTLMMMIHTLTLMHDKRLQGIEPRHHPRRGGGTGGAQRGGEIIHRQTGREILPAIGKRLKVTLRS